MTTDVEYPATGITQEAYFAALEEMREMPNYRADVPAGTVLGESPIEGSDGGFVRHTKRQSMLRAGNTPLPERVMLYNRATGRGSMVPPTIAQKRILEGTRDFPASVFTFRNPGLPQRVPIEEHCWVCDRRRAEAGNPPRDFFDIVQFEAHMQLIHPREWDSYIRQQGQRERIEDRQAMRDTIIEIVRLMRPDLATEADEAGIASEVERQVIRRPRRGAG